MPVRKRNQSNPSKMSDNSDTKLLDDATARVFDTLDPPRDKNRVVPCTEKVTNYSATLFGLFAIIGLPIVERTVIQPLWENGYTPGRYGVPPMFFFVIVFAAVIPSLYLQIGLAFSTAGKGRRIYGYKLPVMYAAVDIHVLDVVNNGKILSQGDTEKAKVALQRAAKYSAHQRAHHNALESFPIFIALALLGGIKYPVTNAIHGILWIIGRVTWTSGYLSGNPIDRYSNPFGMYVWYSLLGVIVSSMVVAYYVLKDEA